MTELHPRECLVRVISNGQIAPAFKARTMDAPVGVAKSAVDLKPYAKALPQKFVEKDEHAAVQIEFSQEYQQMLAEAKKNPQPDPVRVSFTGIKDLLASHSSSRLKVNKEKDKK